MRILFAPIVIGALALAGASPASAQSKPRAAPATSVGTAGGRDWAAERKSYTQQAQDATRIWQQRLHDFDVKATSAQASVSKDLHIAWTATKTATSQMETAAVADWDSAKGSYQTAAAKLAAAWHKVNSTDK
jgi:hypothetical protein